jgi:hypothetical protein
MSSLSQTYQISLKRLALYRARSSRPIPLSRRLTFVKRSLHNCTSERRQKPTQPDTSTYSDMNVTGVRRRRRASLSNDYNERWHQTFSADRKFRDDRPFIETLRAVDADGDDLDLFLSPYEGSVPCCESEEIKRFCSYTGSVSQQPQAAADQTTAKAWLDDREKSTGKSRSSFGLLTASQLFEAMVKPVCPGQLFCSL